MVIHQVPVMADTVTALGAPISMPSSPLAAVSGSAPTDALMRAMQPLGGGPTVEVAGRHVDGVTGWYGFALPTAVPLVASYAAPPAALNFVADTAAAGRYQLIASRDGQPARTSGALVLAPGDDVTVDFP